MRAYAPCHGSGIFEIVEHADVLRTGSRGAGICVDKGVAVRVDLWKGRKCRGKIKISHNRRAVRGATTRAAAKLMLAKRDASFDVHVSTSSELPIGQGLGVSGAAALATALALDAAMSLNLPRAEVVAVAHAAEVTERTGLGDVVAGACGGALLRLSAGVKHAPQVKLISCPADVEFVVGVFGGRVSTARVLSDGARAAAINRAARAQLPKLEKEPTLDNFFARARKFAEQIGLSGRKLPRVLKAIEPYGTGTQCMLGNSIIAVGDTERLVRVLARFGRVWCCRLGTAASVCG
jgi:pantoate kinase